MKTPPLFAILLTTLACATTPPPVQQQSPWSTHPPIQADEVLLAEWQKAENRTTCAPMTLAAFGDEVQTATPRRANFSGGWAVAWDAPGLPGRDGSGTPCATCGRGTFGLAGAGITWDGHAPSIPGQHRLDWPNGEFAIYALEGGAGPAWLAQIRVQDQPCVYQLWSFLGREHLEALIRNVRRATLPR